MTLRPCLACALVALALAAAPPAGPAESAAARESIARLEKELRAELTAAMKEGGPARALSVCRESAPAIASRVSAEMGLEVGRTALKVRNPDNAPDAWERSTLKRFRRALAGGADPATLWREEVVEEGGRRVLRVMRAIPTAEPCLACHGKALAPEIAAKVGALYPEDRATGFEAGELRGAFTVTVPLPPGSP